MKVPYFSGVKSSHNDVGLEEWIDILHSAFKVCNTPRAHTSLFAKRYLVGVAKREIRVLPASKTAAVEDLFHALRKLYGDHASTGDLLKQFYCRRQGRGKRSDNLHSLCKRLRCKLTGSHRASIRIRTLL